jgi:small subunit ribosomal protein S4
MVLGTSKSSRYVGRTDLNGTRSLVLTSDQTVDIVLAFLLVVGGVAGVQSQSITVERQMRRYYERAQRSDGVTGEELIRELETRLDAVTLRLGFALTLRQARQLVSHGHVLVDGKRVDIPSAQVREGQTIEVSAKARTFVGVREAVEIAPEPPPYLYRNKDQMQGTLSRLPERDEIPLPVAVEERLIVEHYS